MTRSEVVLALAREYMEWGDPETLPYEESKRVQCIRYGLEGVAQKLGITDLGGRAKKLDAARIQWEYAEEVYNHNYRNGMIDNPALRRARRRYDAVKREVARA